MRRVGLLVMVVLLCVVPLAGARGVGVPGAQVGFWAGETSGTAVYTPAVWQVLASTHAALYMNVVYGTDFGPGATSTKNLGLIRRANALGVTVNAWITYPPSQGTFSNEENALVSARSVRDFWSWMRAQHLKIHEIVLDLEQATGYQPVTEALAGNLHRTIDPAGQCRAMRTYRDAVSWAHAHGMRLTGTPVPFAMDDVVLDGNMGLSDALDIPGFVPGMYDEVYLQAYRAEFGFELGAEYIVRYWRLMQQYFGSLGQVSLGNTGFPPYQSAGPLVQDIRMLAGLGARAIPIFDFDSAVKSYGVDGLRAVIMAGRQPLRGAALEAAEHSARETSTVQGQGAEQLFAALNEAANAATLAATAGGKPNAWPGGCGPMRPAPLR